MQVINSRLGKITNLTSAIDRHDSEELVNYFTPNVSITRGDGVTHVGRNVVMDLFHALIQAFPDMRLIPTRVQALDKNAVIGEWTLVGTQLGSFIVDGKTFAEATSSRVVKTVFAALLTFDDSNLVERVALHGDTSGLLGDASTLPVAEIDSERIYELAERQTAAWDNHDALALSKNYAETGWIIINGGMPWAGRAGLATMAGSYMKAFPDLAMSMIDIHIAGDRAVWSWNLTGTNTGPDGTGKAVDFSGYEVWRIDKDCLIAESYGYYDSAAYLQQLEHEA